MGTAPRSMGRAAAAMVAAMTAAAMMGSAAHSAAATGAATETSAPAAGIGEFVEQLLSAFDVPGAAVVIVADGGVVLSAGYGLRSVVAGGAVTSETAFAIASLTKAFTATAAASLVGDATIQWQSRAHELLPELALRDPVALERATLADLLTHRSGIGSRTTICLNSSLSRTQLLERLDLVEPDVEFRAGFAYSSLMYAVAGEMLARAAETPYEDVVRSRVLDPIGMMHTTFGPPPGSAGEVAAPHLPVDGETEAIEPVDTSLFAAGIGLYSTADDMGRWLLFQLSGGLVGGAEVVPSTALRATGRPQVVRRSDGLPDAPILAYGMGWEVAVWNGELRLSHGGGAAGFTAQVTMLPDRGVGVVVMTNSALNPVPDLVCERVALQALGLPVPDRLGQARALLARMDELRAAQKAMRRSRQNPEAPPTLPLAGYAGSYRHPLYGNADVVAGPGGLTLRFHRLRFTVEHLHDDVFLIGHPLFDEQSAEFVVSPGGEVTALLIPFDRASSPVRFSAAAGAEGSAPAPTSAGGSQMPML